MAEQDSDRTEAPTPRRREEARQEGNIARSADLTAACGLLAAVVVLHSYGLDTLAHFRQVLQQMLAGEESGVVIRPDDLGPLLLRTGKLAALAAAPMVLCLSAVALLATVAQVGFLVTTKPLEMDFSKISPLKGLGNLFNSRGAVRAALSVAKVGVVAGLAIWSVMGDVPRLVATATLEPMPMLAAACELVYALALKLAVLLLVLAVADYAFQRWQHERDLRMTKQEIKEELKRMEGDPAMKQRRLRIARQMAMQRVQAAVPKADVVVTNPTHFAVALQYDRETMRAPKVVAKGADFLAARIRQLAMMHEVPLVERKELARALYRTVEVGQEIPPEHYNAVAEILAYVYRIGNRRIA